MAEAIMNGKRKEPDEIPPNNTYNDENETKSRKRSRPVWGIEVCNTAVSTVVMANLERFFIKRVCPWEDKLPGMGFTENKESYYFEFQNEPQQKAALCFDGEKVGCRNMRIKPWYQDPDRESDEEPEIIKRTNVDLSKSNSTLKRRVKAVEMENAEMRNQLRDNEGLHRELEEAQRVADDLYHRSRDKEEDMRREIRDLKDDLAGYRRELKDVERENDDLCDRLKKKDKDIDNMHEDLKSSELDNDELCHRLKKRDKDLHNLEEEMPTMERIQKELKSQLEDSQRDNEHQSKRLRDIGEKVKREMDGLKRELKSASQENDHLIRQLRTNDGQYNRDKDMLESKLKRLQAENTLLRRNKESERRMNDLEYQREVSHHGAVVQQKEDKRRWYTQIQSEAMSRDLIDKMKKQESSTPQSRKDEQYHEAVRELEAKLFKVVQDQNVILEENQNLRRDKKDMQQTIAEWEAKEEENEQLREEIEQMRMNHAMEMGLMEGSDESEEVASLKEELERAHQRIQELEGT